MYKWLSRKRFTSKSLFFRGTFMTEIISTWNNVLFHAFLVQAPPFTTLSNEIKLKEDVVRLPMRQLFTRDQMIMYQKLTTKWQYSLPQWESPYSIVCLSEWAMMVGFSSCFGLSNFGGFFSWTSYIGWLQVNWC